MFPILDIEHIFVCWVYNHHTSNSMALKSGALESPAWSFIPYFQAILNLTLNLRAILTHTMSTVFFLFFLLMLSAAIKRNQWHKQVGTKFKLSVQVLGVSFSPIAGIKISCKVSCCLNKGHRWLHSKQSYFLKRLKLRALLEYFSQNKHLSNCCFSG